MKIPQFSRPGAARPDIPIAIAAVNRGMIRAAAAVANGLVGHPIYTRKYIAETVLPELQDSLCVLLPYVICSVANDPAQARNEARMQIAFYYTTRLYHSILKPHGWEASARPSRPRSAKAISPRWRRRCRTRWSTRSQSPAGPTKCAIS